MRALYIDFDYKYINPTRGLLLKLSKLIFNEVLTYGPGYVSYDDLNNGIKTFIKKNGTFDYIITNETVLYSYQSEVWSKDSLKDLYKIYYVRFPKSHLQYKIIRDLSDFLINFEGKLLLYKLQSDFYNERVENLKLLENKKIKIVTFGEDLISSIDELKFIYNEKFTKNKNNLWFDFVRNNKKRIISVPHFLDNSEFISNNFKEKINKVLVPGAKYWFRKEVIKILKNRNYYRNSNLIYPITNFLIRFGFSLYSSEFGINFLSKTFTNSIKTSKFAFTCGSALKMPLRKFFEIPALGTVLICYPFKNADKFGFIDNETCFYVNSPKEFEYKIDKIINDKNLHEKVAKNGLEMVNSLHTITKRAKFIKSKL
jgi:hypothetical protein